MRENSRKAGAPKLSSSPVLGSLSARNLNENFLPSSLSSWLAGASISLQPAHGLFGRRASYMYMYS